ncbi:MAG: bifunctional [glutamine synthetase] adenylyltransferase/[glutamine synthetase]-adenylyl-L-tyrosine phosphorylase [Alphaproteobacteria bacterium]|nr:bifunctional [glutamine synthetase] adenylyltransferase/[glutamine synthetase]-adenylyl-L-tyrosine phosphorylase [Alphaproteobacteria bacterium]
MLTSSVHASLAAAPWPAAAHPDTAAIALERLTANADTNPDAATLLALSREAPVAALLSAVFGNSPYLTHCLLRDAPHAVRLITHGPETSVAEVLGALNPQLAAGENTAEVMAELRRLKRRLALSVAVADIGQMWGVAAVTGALARFADAALDVAIAHLLSKLVGAPPTPGHSRGLIVLGMGKHGAWELNYSSDIDLIVLFDPDRVPPEVHQAAGDRTLQQVYIRLVRDMVRMMEERTGDGYVLRTDLRLRPDPSSTPVALSIRAAEAYYESVGQNWERAAMIKARPVAADREAGQRFLASLRPFLWRRHLDFAAINDIHSIKRQINTQRGGSEVAVLGHNVKLGRGGIREIEFFAQVQQLIWGGRIPALRSSRTDTTLATLADLGKITRTCAEDLTAAYEFLRRVEHRLQMIDDHQTHRLPEDPADLAAVACFLGYPEASEFEVDLMGHLRRVESHYAELFEEAPPLAGPGTLVFTGSDDDPETLATLEGLGFREGARLSAAVRGWHHGRVRAMRSVRARELLTELTPTLLTALSRTVDPDGAFHRFDLFLSNLPAGVQLFSLFYQNPHLLELVALVMGCAPSLADQLGRRPLLLDSLLSDRGEPLGLEGLLDQARDYQDVLDLVRRWAGDARFQIGVRLLRAGCTPVEAARDLTMVADAVIAALLAATRRQFEELHGTLADSDFAVLALGKLGGREMTPASDLDLVFVYQPPEGSDAHSTGPKALVPSVYWNRLAQRLISALTAPTAEGDLYQVDTRLRPHGEKGPIAIALEGFQHYYDDPHGAWTWEFMALTRARVVAATSAEFADHMRQVLDGILCRPREPLTIIDDAVAMRRRLGREKPADGWFDVKRRPGGLTDIEFLVQTLILLHAHASPALVTGSTGDALERLVEADVLAVEDGATLSRALSLLQTIQTLLRLTTSGRLEPTAAPPGLLALLARTTGAVDFPTLAADIDGAAEAAAAVVARRLGPIHAQLQDGANS